MADQKYSHCLSASFRKCQVIRIPALRVGMALNLDQVLSFRTLQERSEVHQRAYRGRLQIGAVEFELNPRIVKVDLRHGDHAPIPSDAAINRFSRGTSCLAFE